MPEKKATLANALRVIVTAREDPDFREQFLTLLGTYLGDYVRYLSREWHVTEENIDAYINAMRVKGCTENIKG